MSVRKNILISAGGTAASWHLASLIASDFSDRYCLFVCDTNPAHLVPASLLAETFLQVPPCDSPGYRQHMLNLFSQHHIDIYVPLIDADVYAFPKDDPVLQSLGVRSVSVSRRTASQLRSKAALGRFLHEKNIPVPRQYSYAELLQMRGDTGCFVKPDSGFGSRGARGVSCAEALALVSDSSLVIQELCVTPEITVEVFNYDRLIMSLCRERIETKSGVCTKARIWSDPQLQAFAETLCNVLDLPVAFCFQVMKGREGQWLLTDLNPRLGAGTALSTAYGWSLAAAALTVWGDGDRASAEACLRYQPVNTYVARVYQELVMK